MIDMDLVAGSVCVVGSLNADVTVRTQRHPMPGETVTGDSLTVLPGGKSANQAVAAARLGAKVRIVGAVGDDSYGQLLMDSLRQDSVDVEYVRCVPDVATGTALITVAAHGENTIVISAGANGQVSPEDVPDSVMAGAGALGLTFEIPNQTVVAAAERAHALGVPVFVNPSPFRVPEAELLACTDVLVVNEHEFEHILGTYGISATMTWQQKATLLHSATGVGSYVITLGSQGAIVLESAGGHISDHTYTITNVPGEKVDAVDTTGCGDAVLGALLATVSGGMSLVEATAVAMKVAAYAATGSGAQPSYPTATQLASNVPYQKRIV